MFPSKVLLQVSGSIACFKAAALASQLVKKGCEVQVVATASALKFVGAATFEGLTSKPVLSDVFLEGHMMDHIHLARWADVILLYPASANTLNRLGAGLADDLIGALALSREPSVPYIVAPAMNHQMWNHPATQQSVATLKAWGLEIAEPNAGELACGETGPGRLVEPEEMMALLEKKFKTASVVNKGKVLITSGGTREAIDSVRFISNMSSGSTGAQLADEFQAAGYDVTYIAAQDAVLPKLQKTLRVEKFSDFKSLDGQLKKLLQQDSYEAVIHAAAVSDYSVEEILGAKMTTGQKLESENELTLKLKPNFKILSRIKSYSKNPGLKLIGFKLTSGNDPQDIQTRIEKMTLESAPDLTVHNDLSQINERQHLGSIYQGLNKVASFSTKAELGQKLITLLTSKLSSSPTLNKTLEVNL